MLFRSNDTATTEIYTHANTLSLHDALPIFMSRSEARSAVLFELETGGNGLACIDDEAEPKRQLGLVAEPGYGSRKFAIVANSDVLEREVGHRLPVIGDDELVAGMLDLTEILQGARLEARF